MTLKHIKVVLFDMLEFMGSDLPVRHDSGIHVHQEYMILYMCTPNIVYLLFFVFVVQRLYET